MTTTDTPAPFRRRTQLDFFARYALPVVNITAPCAARDFVGPAKAAGVPPFAVLLHALARASLEVEPLRWRLVGGEPVRLEGLTVSYTVLDPADDMDFSNCRYDPDFDSFLARYLDDRAAAKTHDPAATGSLRLPRIEGADALFVTGLPWLRFTQLQHPLYRPDDCSIPAVAVGQWDRAAGRVSFPLSIQAHHGLVDGIHIARWMARVSALLDDAAERLAPASAPARPVVSLPVAAAYDRWAAAGYDGADNPMVFAAERVLADACGDVAGKSVVEFGCGTGRNLAWARAAGAGDLIGLDLSAGMLERAAARGTGAALIRHDMTQGTPLPDASADLVLFCLALEHVADPGPPLAEARRLLRPGGRVVVLEIHPALAAGGVGAHFQHAGEEVRMPVHPHRFADHLQALAAAGLRLAHCREWTPNSLAALPGPPLPPKVLKRGPDAPLLVEFVVVAG